MATTAGPSSEYLFRYSASARELAGEFAAPIQAAPTSDACVLPPDGGYAHLIWGPSRLGGVLAIGQGYAETLGRFDEEEKAWQTMVRIALENCNLGEVLTIGRMSATLFSSHPVPSGPPSFSLLNAVFTDVRVAGVPVSIQMNAERYSRRFTYEDLRYGEIVPKGPKPSENEDTRTFPFVEQMNIDSGRFPRVRTDGNTIFVPAFGQIRLGELAVEPERCSLTLVSARLDGIIQGGVDLGILSIAGTPGRTDGVPDRTTEREELEDEEVEPTSTTMDEEEEEEVREALGEWLSTEPEPDRPFLFSMGDSLTPAQFFREVEERTRLGISFLRFLSEQSKQSGEHPRDAIRRAIDANRAE